jgi:N6-adenosine-specific RNA methylase IME4
MSVDEIAALPIGDLVADNAHLHLWTTNAFIFESKQIIEAWGFEYKSCLVWVKPQMGIGNYWRVSHEFLLLGVRGRCPFLDRSKMSWVRADRTRHSSKPEEVVQAIEAVSPAPYLELFGRKTREGWTVWGNEIERTIFNEAAFEN